MHEGRLAVLKPEQTIASAIGAICAAA